MHFDESRCILPPSRMELGFLKPVDQIQADHKNIVDRYQIVDEWCQLRSHAERQKMRKQMIKMFTISALRILERGNYLTWKAVYYLSLGQWFNLIEIILADSEGAESNQIGEKGIKYLTRIYMPKLTHFTLEKQKLTGSSVVHIHKADWPKLREFSFRLNKLFGNEVRLLAKAKWHELRQVLIGWNEIAYDQMLMMMTAHWPVFATDDSMSYEIRSNQAWPKKQNKLKRLARQKWKQTLLVLKYSMYSPDNQYDTE